MPDKPTIKGRRDQNRVNVNQDYEVEYWTKAFNCTPGELRQGVDDAGTTQKDRVRAAIDKKRK